jgi:SAM-dependent methyltransferase
MSGNDDRWDRVGEAPAPSWYLDPLVARQKREAHQRLVREWTNGRAVESVLKTDLFEEAFGEDQILFDLFPESHRVIGIDVSRPTAARALRRSPAGGSCFLTADVRCLPLRSDLVDVIVSNSTLDHFDSREEFQAALGELARVLRPGGVLVITVDNAYNPLYQLLRLLARAGFGPFPLGYTTSLRGLILSLEKHGLEVTGTTRLIHNPRLISTLLFLGLRRTLGKRADLPIRWLLGLFSRLDVLPTWPLTACFVAACARKPGSRTVA